MWDAFGGTAQPTFPEGLQPAGGGSLGLVVDEFGWQVEIGPGLASRYNGAENVPTISEAEQATYYAELVRMLACDPAVTDAMVFHLVDEVDLGRFQTGLLRIDGSERPSYDAMRAAIVSAPSCGPLTAWSHATGVVGAQAVFGTQDQPARRAVFGISATAAEDAVAKAGIFRVPGSKAKPKTGEIERSLASPGRSDEAGAHGREEVKAGYTPRMEFRGRLAPGHYVFGVRLTAAMNPGRSQTLVSKTFKVG